MTTRSALLTTAERMIAVEGIGVSLRSIAAEADANSAAIHYHFGSKEELVVAVLDQRMSDMAQRRLDLSEALSMREGITVRDVMLEILGGQSPERLPSQWRRSELTAALVDIMTGVLEAPLARASSPGPRAGIPASRD